MTIDTSDFDYDLFLKDVSHEHMDVGIGVESLRCPFQSLDIFDTWWLSQQGKLGVNQHRIAQSFLPVASRIINMKQMNTRQEYEYNLLTLPTVIHHALHGNYLEVLHKHVEARVCIDMTILPITKEQRRIIRRLYCTGYLLAMGLCVNMYRPLGVPSMNHERMQRVRHNSDIAMKALSEQQPSYHQSLMSPYAHGDLEGM